MLVVWHHVINSCPNVRYVLPTGQWLLFESSFNPSTRELSAGLRIQNPSLRVFNSPVIRDWMSDPRIPRQAFRFQTEIYNPFHLENILELSTLRQLRLQSVFQFTVHRAGNFQWYNWTFTSQAFFPIQDLDLDECWFEDSNINMWLKSCPSLKTFRYKLLGPELDYNLNTSPDSPTGLFSTVGLFKISTALEGVPTLKTAIESIEIFEARARCGGNRQFDFALPFLHDFERLAYLGLSTYVLHGYWLRVTEEIYQHVPPRDCLDIFPRRLEKLGLFGVQAEYKRGILGCLMELSRRRSTEFVAFQKVTFHYRNGKIDRKSKAKLQGLLRAAGLRIEFKQSTVIS
ncbi:uncharacterized protein BDZ99DRAFT_468704 [Mytilinidion resinicola]|uniref:Uncharacterized protein n=1 Tax=Mytilinidion resinicola TaxID=574789 RepID=A0A6A6Y2J1_9PEZI|nr:uncharacterized protein BDZ99DRAFT_468704 [Mytilinidion resinicola]KAF2802733.1 hypothetical protein BDZ99DRAFT_468704 [Mytilinidion resinicola]